MGGHLPVDYPHPVFETPERTPGDRVRGNAFHPGLLAGWLGEVECVALVGADHPGFGTEAVRRDIAPEQFSYIAVEAAYLNGVGQFLAGEEAVHVFRTRQRGAVQQMRGQAQSIGSVGDGIIHRGVQFGHHFGAGAVVAWGGDSVFEHSGYHRAGDLTCPGRVFGSSLEGDTVNFVAIAVPGPATLKTQVGAGYAAALHRGGYALAKQYLQYAVHTHRNHRHCRRHKSVRSAAATALHAQQHGVPGKGLLSDDGGIRAFPTVVGQGAAGTRGPDGGGVFLHTRDDVGGLYVS